MRSRVAPGCQCIRAAPGCQCIRAREALQEYPEKRENCERKSRILRNKRGAAAAISNESPEKSLTKNLAGREPPTRTLEDVPSNLANERNMRGCRATGGVLKECVRKHIQAVASQKGRVATPLAPKSLLDAISRK